LLEIDQEEGERNEAVKDDNDSVRAV
jgi:hypothetical protein